MKITKADLENYRYDKRQAEANSDTAELERLKGIVSHIRRTVRGSTRIVIFERYINGNGISRYGGQETWNETAERVGLSAGYCKTLCSDFFEKLSNSK